MFAEIVLILALILLNGLFSLSEMAIVSSRKARLRHEAEQGKAAYRLALAAAEQPGRFLSAIQVAITLIGILTGAVGGATISTTLGAWLASFPRLAPIATPLSVGIIVLVTTLVSVILGELVPKNLALSRPEAISAAIIRPLSIIARIFDPLVRLLSGTTNLLVRLFGFSHKDEPEVTEDEVKILIAQGAETGIFENSEKEMVEGVLNLDDRRVTAFMTPRTDVVTLNLEDGIPQLREELLRKADYALLPVIEGDLDRIAGMLNVRKALASIATIPTDAAFDPKAFCQPPVLIPETVSALRAMAILKDKSARTALIVDEYGGVSGLVTMADLLESVLAGLDEDESDAMPGVVQREDGSFLVDGALAIADFAEALELDEAMFDMDAYDTVAGLVLDCMGTIPHAGDHCEWQSLRIEIMDMDGHRVDKVLVNRLSVTDPASLP